MKLSIIQAAYKLEDAGYSMLGGGQFDMSRMVATYVVRTPEGETQTLTSDEINTIIS